MIEHCISALSERREVDRYREYLCECLQTISENTAKLVSGAHVTAKYGDYVKRKSKAAETAEQDEAPGAIAERIKSKFR